MRCSSAPLRGVYGRGLTSGATGSSPAPTSACDLLSMLSTPALPEGVYGSARNNGVPVASHTCDFLCGVHPPPRFRGGGGYTHEPSLFLPKLTREPTALCGEPGAPSEDPSCSPA